MKKIKDFTGVNRYWGTSRTSNPVWGLNRSRVGFDSHSLPPIENRNTEVRRI